MEKQQITVVVPISSQAEYIARIWNWNDQQPERHIEAWLLVTDNEPNSIMVELITDDGMTFYHFAKVVADLI